jgi:hypothetical protein
MPQTEATHLLLLKALGMEALGMKALGQQVLEEAAPEFLAAIGQVRQRADLQCV